MDSSSLRSLAPGRASGPASIYLYVIRLYDSIHTTTKIQKQEIELNRDFFSLDEELVLALVHTHQLMERVSERFLSAYDLTPTQFNALMIVRDYESDGIRQIELARRLLINRASTGTLVDNLCTRALMQRRPVPEDRRAYHLVLTRQGRLLLTRIHAPYHRHLQRLTADLAPADKRRVCRALTKLRARLRTLEVELTAHA